MDRQAGLMGCEFASLQHAPQDVDAPHSRASSTRMTWGCAITSFLLSLGMAASFRWWNFRNRREQNGSNLGAIGRIRKNFQHDKTVLGHDGQRQAVQHEKPIAVSAHGPDFGPVDEFFADLAKRSWPILPSRWRCPATAPQSAANTRGAARGRLARHIARRRAAMVRPRRRSWGGLWLATKAAIVAHSTRRVTGGA